MDSALDTRNQALFEKYTEELRVLDNRQHAT
ncbi:IDEAL domain-containing protein [Alkalicoccobacillus plakortidis]|nr:IDEAL domain-containing protein [Alkalicoccobacillus plakortidis]